MTEVPVTEIPEGALLLDVREIDEWQAGHAPDARHIPMSDMSARVGELPRDQQIAVICKMGGRSARVTGFLVQQGFQAVNVDGGMTAWHAAGLPMVSDKGDPRVL